MEYLVENSLRHFQLEASLASKEKQLHKNPDDRENVDFTKKMLQNGEYHSENSSMKYSRSPRSACLSMKPVCRTSRVTLTKEFYYCTPPKCSLDLLVDDSGRCLVDEFRVGHEAFGHVTFHGETDVIGMNLDSIVEFKLKELNLYPDEENSKQMQRGNGLRRPATVVLFNVWPINKEKTNFITDPVELSKRKYENLLQRSCSRMNTRFLNYNPVLGQWSFKINC
jgi:hypothetical protein